MTLSGPVRLADGVWRITTPLPFRPRTVHAYLIDSEAGFLLVDGGLATPGAWAALDAGVRTRAGGWAAVRRHVVTHMHMDHLGLARRVREACDARLVMGRLDAERATHAAREPGEEAEYRESMLRRHGAPPEMIERVQAGRAKATGLVGFVEPQELLDGEGGPLPDVPGWEWRWTPGHTAGHVSLIRTADRVAVAGDAVLPKTTPTIGVNRQRRDPVADYLDALDRLDGVRPRLLLPGHGDPIAQPARRTAQLRDETRAETRRVHDLVGDEPLTAWELALHRHPDPELPTSTRMLALREVLAHLDHLVAVGHVARVELRGGAVAFRATGRLPAP